MTMAHFAGISPDQPRLGRDIAFQARDKKLLPGRKTLLMGVVNITPDSFYDGGKYLAREKAVERCLQLAAEGADILDLGGESSRPSAQPVDPAEEKERVLPVLKAVRCRLSIPISIDTCKSEVAREALEAGADIINDITALRGDRNMAPLVGRFQSGVILMHMRGTPADMQKRAPSKDILSDIRNDLAEALRLAAEHDIARDRIILDPGIGFGKTAEDNLRILNRLGFLEEFQLPILIGTSRKSFLGKVLRREPSQLMWGTAASVAVAILRGAHIIRVHDVEEMRMVAEVTDAILSESLS